MHYWILRAICIFILKAFFKFRVEGLDNIPQKTNFIVAGNHTSYLDVVLVGSAFPKKIYWITRREVYNWVFLKFVRLKKEALPEGRSSESAINLLMRGKNIGIFPEGGLSRDGQLREFRRGAALLALRTGRPIVPCAIFGASEVLPRGAKFIRLAPITVKIGKPHFLLREYETVVDDILLQEGTLRIKTAIKEMMHV